MAPKHFTSKQIRHCRHGRLVRVWGRIIIIHTPPTRSKRRVMFLTLEDPAGLIDVTVFEDVQRICAKTVLSSRYLVVDGVMQRFGARGVGVLAKRIQAGSNPWGTDNRHPTGSLEDAATPPQTVLPGNASIK